MSEREIALTRANLGVAETRKQMQRESEDALATAEREWKATESERLAAAHAQWQASLEQTVAAAKADVESRARADATELRQLREEVESMRRCLAEEEAALARATVDIAASREQARREVQAAVQNAEQGWKADEAARLASAARQWQDTMEHGSGRGASGSKGSQFQQ